MIRRVYHRGDFVARIVVYLESCWEVDPVSARELSAFWDFSEDWRSAEDVRRYLLGRVYHEYRESVVKHLDLIDCICGR